MTTKARTTRQGIRDLNFYGSRKKEVEPGAVGPLSGTDSGTPAPLELAKPDADLVTPAHVAVSGT